MGHVGVALASPDEAPLESEYPARSCFGGRVATPSERLHSLHQGRQGRQGRLTRRAALHLTPMQGVIKAFDPVSAQGVIMCDTDLADYDIADGALDGSVFRMLRQGQRVVFDLDDAGRATALRLGSEVDMGTPGY